MSRSQLQEVNALMTDQDRAYLQTLEQWTQFLSALAHELRTPLASLRMLAELLAGAPKDHLGDQEKRYAVNIQDVVQDMQSLVGDVAELARFVGGRAQVRTGKAALEELVDQIKEAVRPAAWERGIALTDSLDPALPQVFWTDPDRLRQALTLLVGAAVSHAESEVFVRLDFGDGDDGDLRAVISSDGPAFPEAAPETLFEPFDKSVRPARRHGGHSLALPLANEIARALGGTLQVVNRGGRPTFDLSVPSAGS